MAPRSTISGPRITWREPARKTDGTENGAEGKKNESFTKATCNGDEKQQHT